MRYTNLKITTIQQPKGGGTKMAEGVFGFGDIKPIRTFFAAEDGKPTTLTAGDIADWDIKGAALYFYRSGGGGDRPLMWYEGKEAGTHRVPLPFPGYAAPYFLIFMQIIGATLGLRAETLSRTENSWRVILIEP